MRNVQIEIEKPRVECRTGRMADDTVHFFPYLLANRAMVVKVSNYTATSTFVKSAKRGKKPVYTIFLLVFFMAIQLLYENRLYQFDRFDE